MTHIYLPWKVAPALLTALFFMTPTPLGVMEINSDAAKLIVGAANRPLPDVRSPRAIVRERASRSGWKGSEWRCLDAIIYAESRWNPRAANKHSSARGLFQMLKQDPSLSVEEQTARGLRYVESRYGSPCKALQWHVRHGWY